MYPVVEELSDVSSIDCTVFSHRGNSAEQMILINRLSTHPINVPPKYFTSKEAFDTTSKALGILQNGMRFLELKLKKAIKQCDDTEKGLYRALMERDEVASTCDRYKERVKRLELESSKLIEEVRTHQLHRNSHINLYDKESCTKLIFPCLECGKTYPSYNSLLSHTTKRHVSVNGRTPTRSTQEIPIGAHRNVVTAPPPDNMVMATPSHNEVQSNCASFQELSRVQDELQEVRALVNGLLNNQNCKSMSVSQSSEGLTTALLAELNKIHEALYQSNNRLIQVEAGINSQRQLFEEFEQQKKTLEQHRAKHEELQDIVSKMKSSSFFAPPSTSNKGTPLGPSTATRSATTPQLQQMLQFHAPQSLNSTMLTERDIKDILENCVVSPMSTERSLTTHHFTNASIEAPSISLSPSVRSAKNTGSSPSALGVSPTSTAVAPKSAVAPPALPLQAPTPSPSPAADAAQTKMDSPLTMNVNEEKEMSSMSTQISSSINVTPGLSRSLGLPFLFRSSDAVAIPPEGAASADNVVREVEPTTQSVDAELPHSEMKLPVSHHAEDALPHQNTPQHTDNKSTSSMSSPAPVTPPQTLEKSKFLALFSTPPGLSGPLAAQKASETETAENTASAIPLQTQAGGAISGSDSKLAFFTSIIESATPPSQVVAVPAAAPSECIASKENTLTEIPAEPSTTEPAKPPESSPREAKESPAVSYRENSAPAVSEPLLIDSPSIASVNPAKKKPLAPPPLEDESLEEDSVIALPPPPHLLAAAAKAMGRRMSESISSSYYYSYSESEKSSSYSDSEEEYEESDTQPRAMLGKMTLAASEKLTPEKTQDTSLVLENLSSSELPKISLTDITEKKKKSVGIFKKMFSKK